MWDWNPRSQCWMTLNRTANALVILSWWTNNEMWDRHDSEKWI
jgi:hypothetical protein